MFRRCLALTAVAVMTMSGVVPASAAPTPAVAAEGSGYTAVTPVRALDTRYGIGAPTAAVGAGQTIVLDLSARIPASTTAVVLNVTGTDTTGTTFVSVWPSDVARPDSSNLNLVRGETRPNLVTTKVSPARTVSLYNNLGSVNLIADLAGYYSSSATSRFTPLLPQRIFDTRTGTGVGAPNPDGTLSMDFTGVAPAGATAVTFNLTATNVSARTFVTAWPHGRPMPNASNLNVVTGETRGNLVTVALGTGLKVDLYKDAGTLDLIADVTGFYGPGEGVAFYPLTPVRVGDTRPHGPATPSNPLRLDLRAHAPAGASAFILNATATQASVPSSVAVLPSTFENAAVDTFHAAPGQDIPTLTSVVSGVSTDVLLLPTRGSVHLIADLAGYFAPVATTCATGCVQAMGEHDAGMLGSGGGIGQRSYFTSPSPTPVSGLDQVTSIVHRYALRADGTVWAWGPNGSGQLGRGWHATEGFGPVPAQVKNLSNVTGIAASYFTAYALRSDGTVWGWGDNTSGALGSGTTATQSDLPIQVVGLTDVTAIAASSGTGYALRSDGTLWAWGNNINDDLGNGTSDGSSTTPVRVSNLTGVTAIAAGGNSRYALRSDGTVWSWGSNVEGQFGNTTASGFSNVPVQVPTLTGVTAVAAGYATGYALLPDKTLRAWGSNSWGAAGTGSGTQVLTPRKVADLTDVATISAAMGNAFVLKTDGTAWGWGVNTWGQLGNTAQAAYYLPQRITAIPAASAIGTTGTAAFAVIG